MADSPQTVIFYSPEDANFAWLTRGKTVIFYSPEDANFAWLTRRKTVILSGAPYRFLG
jgi:hypothetical protein